MSIPTITIPEVQRFAREYTTQFPKPGGLSIVVDPLHAKFTADFCNVVLQSFVQQYINQQLEAQKPKIVLAEK